VKWLDSMPTRARLFKSLRSLRPLNPDVDSPAMTDAWQSSRGLVKSSCHAGTPAALRRSLWASPPAADADPTVTSRKLARPDRSGSTAAVRVRVEGRGSLPSLRPSTCARYRAAGSPRRRCSRRAPRSFGVDPAVFWVQCPSIQFCTKISLLYIRRFVGNVTRERGRCLIAARKFSRALSIELPAHSMRSTRCGSPAGSKML